MEQAIKLVEEQGYKIQKCDYANLEHAFIDPSFWQALGKALGWKYVYPDQVLCVCGYIKGVHGGDLTGTWPTTSLPCNSFKPQNNEMPMDWLGHWHRFIDWIAEGKDPESFFQELTKSKGIIL